jgi:SMODS-associating 2TM, beta-strand rich effector domain
MPTSNWTRLVIALAATITLGIVWATSGKLDTTYAKATVTATSAVTLLLLAFDRWLWRYAPFRWAVSRPVLHGTWKMIQRTTYESRAAETMEAYLVVHQTYSTIRVDGLYAISESQSLSADLAVEKSRCVLSYIFRTDAHTMHRAGNPPSRGAATLKVGRRPQLHLEGDYWMERGTRGSVKSVGYAPKTYDTFEAARQAAYKPHRMREESATDAGQSVSTAGATSPQSRPPESAG